MGKCPDTSSGVNCNYVGCCPWDETCLNDDVSDLTDMTELKSVLSTLKHLLANNQSSQK